MNIPEWLMKFLSIFDKVLDHFSPERVEQKKRARLEELRRERIAITNSKPTTELAVRLKKVEDEIKEIETFLMSKV